MVSSQKRTDSMKDIHARDIGPGSVTCPSCKSDRWNSAIMVVMEGTTNARNASTATARTAATQLDGVRASLLADRWYSWDYPIEADVGLNASTGLVQEVKRFMAEYGRAVQMPPPPTEPNPATSVRHLPNEIRQSAAVAQLPTEETPSVKVEEPVTRTESRQSIARSLLARLLLVTVPLITGVIGLYAFLDNHVLAAWTLFMLSSSIIIIAMYKAKIPMKKIEEAEHGPRDGDNLPEAFEHYAKDRDRFHEEAERFKVRYEESRRMLDEYKNYLAETATYEQQLAEYETKKRSVLKARELLWARTRLCMGCGTAYLGPD